MSAVPITASDAVSHDRVTRRAEFLVGGGTDGGDPTAVRTAFPD